MPTFRPIHWSSRSFVLIFLHLSSTFAQSQQNLTCPPTGEAFLANPVDCRSYYYCWNGERYLQLCPRGYYFHLAGQKCESPQVADCGGFTPAPTPIPPTRPTFIPTFTSIPTSSQITPTITLPTTVSIGPSNLTTLKPIFPVKRKPDLCLIVCSSTEPPNSNPIRSFLFGMCRCQIVSTTPSVPISSTTSTTSINIIKTIGNAIDSLFGKPPSPRKLSSLHMRSKRM